MVHLPQGNGVTLRNQDLFNELKKHPAMKPTTKESKDKLLSYILDAIGVTNLCAQDKNHLRNSIHSFCTSASRYWIASGRNTAKLENKHHDLLCKCIVTSGNQSDEPSTSQTKSRGRPKQRFSDLSERSKRRRLTEEVSTKSAEELCLAAKMKLYKLGKRTAASSLQNISSTSESSKPGNRSSEQYENYSYSEKEALALFTDLKLTRNQYIELRASAVRKNLKHLYPPYYKIIKEKEKCYPPNIIVTDISAEVSVQNLLDHTVSRIAENQSDVLMSMDEKATTNITMIYKWGADGSGSQNNYKQTFECEDSNDSNIFITSLVPLRLQSKQDNKETVIWQNPRANSTRFCRPIRFQFIKETEDTIKSEFDNIETQINNLTPTAVTLSDRTLDVNHCLFKTMVDGKVCNALSSNKSTQKCYICKAPSTKFNELVGLEPIPYDPNTLEFGISSLHANIRFFECLLHISYKLPIKSWQARGEENKKIVTERKKSIQKEFRKKLGLLVDVPKQGLGNTNDGNTARTFFNNPDITHEITGINRDLIVRFGIILKTLSCPYKINSTLFSDYAKETAKLYVQLYKWYPMPPTVHKVLAHGKDIIDNFLLPIGQLGEDAQECRHKEVKYYREHNTRKMSRKETNEDLFKILLVSSDPQISSLRPLPQRKKGAIPCKVLALLEEPCMNNEEDNQ